MRSTRVSPTVTVERAVEGLRRDRQLDAVEREGAEDPLHVLADRPHRRRGGDHAGQPGRGHACHLRGRPPRGDDPPVAEQLVAVAVVAVGVGVDDGPDLDARCGGAHGGEHLGGELEVEQRVDEERVAAIDDQTGVAPAPPTVGLQPGQNPVGHLRQPTVIRDPHGTDRARCARRALTPAVGRGPLYDVSAWARPG